MPHNSLRLLKYLCPCHRRWLMSILIFWSSLAKMTGTHIIFWAPIQPLTQFFRVDASLLQISHQTVPIGMIPSTMKWAFLFAWIRTFSLAIVHYSPSPLHGICCIASLKSKVGWTYSQTFSAKWIKQRCFRWSVSIFLCSKIRNNAPAANERTRRRVYSKSTAQ